jgi:hypothetical protein
MLVRRRARRVGSRDAAAAALEVLELIGQKAQD